MDRRKFLALSGALAGAGAIWGPMGGVEQAAQAAEPARAGGKTRMRVGCQRYGPTEENLRYYQRCGVWDLVCGVPASPSGEWRVEDLLALRKRTEAYGITVNIIQAPWPKNVLLGKSPERDEEIAAFCRKIRVAARAGIPALKYNLYILPTLRTKSAIGRGGVTYSTWSLAESSKGEPLAWPPGMLLDNMPKSNYYITPEEAGRLPAETYWERIEYFLQRVVPVAERYKVRIACHPNDTPTPPGFKGIDSVLGTVEGLKRFVATCDSEYHGLLFCQGTVAEMLQNPGREIYDVIRYFGSRRKIFLVHFRNLRGHRDDFQEVYPDEGDIDMFRAMKVYHEVGYPHLLIPDHLPNYDDKATSPEDPDTKQGFAFAYGYIKALIQAVSA